MFKSKRRPIVTPQSEHLKLVGTLAMLWGNSDFDTPPIERESMILGMGTHDRGYGYLDNHPIGGMVETEWFPIARRTFYMPCSDVVADTIVKYHFRRLASHDDSAGRKALTAEFSAALDARRVRISPSILVFHMLVVLSSPNTEKAISFPSGDHAGNTEPLLTWLIVST